MSCRILAVLFLAAATHAQDLALKAPSIGPAVCSGRFTPVFDDDHDTSIGAIAIDPRLAAANRPAPNRVGGRQLAA